MHLRTKVSARHITTVKYLTGQELLFNLDGLYNDPPDNIWVRTSLEVAEEQACEIGMHSLITAD